jgi:hypothetical protein
MLDDPPSLDDSRRASVEALLSDLIRRTQATDPEEVDETRTQIGALLDAWAMRGDIRYFWSDYRPRDSLLVSAEKAAEARAIGGSWTHAAIPTPNSMREVEPSVRYRLAERLAPGAEVTDDSRQNR